MHYLKLFKTRRNHLQVLSEILEMCRTPRAKTHILRESNTSFKLLEAYLFKLQTSGLIELQPQTRKYRTTEGGQRFIEFWININAMLDPQETQTLTKSKRYIFYDNRLITIPTVPPNLSEQQTSYIETA